MARFEKALSLQPGMQEPLQYIVSSYVSKGETKKAIDLVEAQLKASPGNAFLLNTLGSLYEMNKDTANAEQYYRKAIESNPGAPDLYVSLANFYVRQNMTDKAIGELKAALQKNPNSISANMALAGIYQSQKKNDLAKEHYKTSPEGQSQVRGGGQQPRLHLCRRGNEHRRSPGPRTDGQGAGAGQPLHVRHPRLGLLQEERIQPRHRLSEGCRRQDAQSSPLSITTSAWPTIRTGRWSRQRRNLPGPSRLTRTSPGQQRRRKFCRKRSKNS